MAVAMGSGSQITKGVADIVLLKDQFSMLPRAVGEGRRIARNIHRLGRLYLTKSVYAAVLIALTSVLGFTFPFLPRHLTIAAFLTIGIPSFVLALAPSEGPLYRGRLLRALAVVRGPGRGRDRRRLDALVLLRGLAGRRHRRGGPHRGDHHPDRARPLLHPAARARAGARAHHDPELHAGDDRRARRAVRPDPRGRARCATSSSWRCWSPASGSWRCSRSRSGSWWRRPAGGSPTSSISRCPRARRRRTTASRAPRTRRRPRSSRRVPKP